MNIYVDRHEIRILEEKIEILTYETCAILIYREQKKINEAPI